MKKLQKNETGRRAATHAPKRRYNFAFTEKTAKRLILAFFVILWLVLAFFESVQLYRIQDQSLFLNTTLFFKEMMQAPAGLLSYIGCFLIQFFYYPALVRQYMCRCCMRSISLCARFLIFRHAGR